LLKADFCFTKENVAQTGRNTMLDFIDTAQIFWTVQPFRLHCVAIAPYNSQCVHQPRKK